MSSSRRVSDGGLFFQKTLRWKVILAYTLVAALLLGLIFGGRVFPAAYNTGRLTLFGTLSGYIAGLILLAAAARIRQQRVRFDQPVYQLLSTALILSVVADLLFVFQIDAHNITNFSGHVLSIISLYFVYRAAVITAIDQPHELMFQKLQKSTAQLQHDDRELTLKNTLLKKENAEIEALFSSIEDSIVSTDQNGIIHYTNSAFAKMVNLPHKNIRGQNITEIFTYYDDNDRPVPKSKRLLEIAFAREKPSVLKRAGYHYVNSAGHHIDLLVIVAPILDQGTIIGGITIFRDITRQKEIEQTKTEYVSFAAHQLRTPLSVIRLTMEMIAAELAKNEPGDVAQYLKDVVDETDAMTQTIHHFLNVTKIEANLFTVSPKPLEIAELIGDHLKLLIPQIKDKHIGLETDFDPLLPAVKMDPKVFDIVFDNLLSNAIKYTEPSGRILVQARKTGRSVLISVENNGAGIPEGDKSKIFKKMFRASNVSNAEGTGLGLYIVKLLVIQSGGKIWLESAENRTVFNVSYPLSGMKKTPAGTF